MDKIIPISDLQTKAKKFVEQVKRTNEPVIITQRGRAAAILVNFDTYEGHRATQDEMAHADWKQKLSRAQREAKRGKKTELEKYLRTRFRNKLSRKAA